MKKNHMKSLLDAGKPVIGAQLRLGSPAVAELFGCAGFDYVIFDSEHAPQTATEIRSQIMGLSSTEATPIVRLPKNDPDLFQVYLDMGVGGILAPLVRTAEEVERGGRACRFPPRGTRGFGPDRANRYGFDADYFEEADDQILYFVIIETAEAVEAIDAILAVKELDGYIIGPYDLSISLGLPRQFDHPDYLAAVDKVHAAARKAGKPTATSLPATGSTPESFREALSQGHQILLAGGDEWILESVTRGVVESFSRARG